MCVIVWVCVCVCVHLCVWVGGGGWGGGAIVVWGEEYQGRVAFVFLLLGREGGQGYDC